MSIGILGSGFGIYGYLPALAIGLQKRIILPSRYHEKLLDRADVGHLEACIDWAHDDDEVLARSKGLIIALRPADQIEWVARASRSPILDRVLLEKPVAPDPTQARQAVELLEQNGKSFQVGFNFRYTAWAKQLMEWAKRSDASSTLAIEWRFRAHHYATGRDNWKRRPSQGGGALRFFGIHLIGLLAELGYTAARNSIVRGSSLDDAECWTAEIAGPGLPTCSLVVNSNADDAVFAVQGSAATARARLAISLRDPFEASPVHGSLDRRVDVLTELCKSTFCTPARTPAWLRSTIELWDVIESGTMHRLSQT